MAVNGCVLRDADLDTGLEQPVAADAQVDLHSADRLALVRDALRGLALEFEQASSGQTEIADRLASGDVATAMRDVSTFIGLWRTCTRALAECSKLLNEDLTRYEHNGHTVQTALEDLIGRLRDMREALDARDTVLLADIVRYELPPLCQTWQTLLLGLTEHVDHAPNPG